MSLKMVVNDRRYAPMFWTQFFGALNDNVFKNALVMMVTFEGASVWGLDKGSVVALAGGLFILPFFLFSPIAGQFADKLEKSRLIRITKFWEVLVMIIASVGFYYHQFGMLLIVLFLAGVQATLFGPLKYSILPDLVKPGELMKGTAYVEGGTFLAILLGTIIGGVVVRLPGSERNVSLVLVGLAIAGLVSGILVPAVTGASPDLKVNFNPLPNFKSLHQILLKNSQVYLAVVVISWFWFYGAAVLSILPVYCKDSLNVNESVVTGLLAMFTIGIAIGSVFCERISRGHVRLKWLPLAAAGMTVFLGDIYFVRPTWPITGELITLPQFLTSLAGIRLLVDFFFMCVFGGVFILPLYTLLQEESLPEERSRVVAANNILNAVFMVFASILVMGLNGLSLSHPSMFGILAVLNFVVTFLLLYRPKAKTS